MPLHAPLFRATLASLAFALAASARTAAADPPPSDFPPLPTGSSPSAVPPTQPPALSPSPPPALTPPIAPFSPPKLGLPPAPPGYSIPYGYYPYRVVAPPAREAVALPPPPPRHYYSPALFGGGVAAVGVGMGTVLLGSYFVASAAGRIQIYCDTPSFPCAYKTDGQRLTAGAIMMAGGTLVAVAGIPMWFIGSRYVFDTDEKKAARRAEPPVDVRVGAGTASVLVRF
jgi:hypothetical protein